MFSYAARQKDRFLLTLKCWREATGKRQKSVETVYLYFGWQGIKTSEIKQGQEKWYKGRGGKRFIDKNYNIWHLQSM